MFLRGGFTVTKLIKKLDTDEKLGSSETEIVRWSIRESGQHLGR